METITLNIAVAYCYLALSLIAVGALHLIWTIIVEELL
jgi:hypothetical protein